MVKLRTVLGVLAFAIVASLFGTTVRVHAAYSDLANNPYSQVKSYLYVEGLVECSRNGKTNISNTDAISGNWFSQGNIPFGAALFPPTGSVTCDNGWIDGALSFWGITEKRALLCELAERGGSCATDGSPITLKQTNADAVRRAISQRFYGGASTDLSAPAYYILFKETFIKGCQASPYAEVGKLNSDQQSIVNSDPDHYRVANIVDDTTGNVTRWYYKTIKGYNAGIATAATWGDRDCQQLETEMNNRADTYAQWVKGIIASGGTVADGTVTGSGGDQETCNISGIGWLVCPIAKFGAKITDWAYAGAEQLMQIQPISITDTSTTNPIYTIWNSVKNIANIAFIVAFFMVIFSQATSIGISAYGIRKMLPRLIAAAILVNLSYYICAFGVDVSNVVGSSIDGVIKGAYVANSGQQATDPTPWTTLITAALAGVGAYAGISSVLAATGGAAAGTSAIGAAFAMILPFLTIALFAIMTALAVLVARHALIIMLTIVAPLAFVAYILPNTENLFGKWKKAFISMLVFYPLAAILFSGSQVASMVLRDSSGGNEFLRVASLGVLFFPLFGLPFLLKFSGGLLSRIAGTLNNPNKGPFDRLRKRAEGYRDFKRDSAQEKAAEFRRNNPTSWRGRRYGKSVQREDIYKAAQTRNEEARQKYTNSLLAPSDEGGAPVDPKFAAKMAGLGRKDAKLLKSHGEANAVLERYNQQYTQLANATEPRKKILKAAQDAQKRIDDGTAMAGDVEKVERGNRLKAAISAQATSLTGVDGTLAAQRVAEISGEIGDVKLDKAIRIMARGQAVVDEIDAKDIKAQTTLQSNLRLDGAGLKKVLEQEIGTTVVGMTGKSIVVTEAAKAAAGASMISQGRETDTVMAAVSKIQDPGIRSFLVGQIGANYATIKGRQVGLTDEALQQQIISGDFDTANDPTGTKFKQALLEATVRKISTLTPQAYASQEATSMTAITEALNQNLLTPNDQDLVISFSRQVETNDTIKQLVPAASRRFHADINARNGLASTTPQAPQPVTINFTVSPPAPVAGPTPAPILTPATDALSQVNTSGGWTNPQLSDQLVYKLYEHAADPALASDPDAPQLRTEAEAELKRRGILPP